MSTSSGGSGDPMRLVERNKRRRAVIPRVAVLGIRLRAL